MLNPCWDSVVSVDSNSSWYIGRVMTSNFAHSDGQTSRIQSRASCIPLLSVDSFVTVSDR